MDLFATQYNHKCPTFVSPTPDARDLNTDALTIDREGMFAYEILPQQVLPNAELHSAIRGPILDKAELVSIPPDPVREDLNSSTSLGKAI